jgi:hypothetical protein
MDDRVQLDRAVGRYPAGRPDRILYSILGLLFLVPGALWLTGGDLRGLIGLVVGACWLLLAWAVPATIVTPAGFRRGRFLRPVPWADVTTVYRPPRGGDVQVRLRDDRVRRLDGVKADRLAGIVLLAHAAASSSQPPSAPG